VEVTNYSGQDRGELPALVLHVPFETEEKPGEFYSLGIGARDYGLVWPDRSVQPELWQVKKVPQPVLIEAVDSSRREARVTNRYAFSNLNSLMAEWELSEDGEVIQHGPLSVDIQPKQSQLIRVPWEALWSEERQGVFLGATPRVNGNLRPARCPSPLAGRNRSRETSGRRG